MTRSTALRAHANATAWAARGGSPIAIAIVGKYASMSAYARRLRISPSALSRYVYGSRRVPEAITRAVYVDLGLSTWPIRIPDLTRIGNST